MSLMATSLILIMQWNELVIRYIYLPRNFRLEFTKWIQRLTSLSFDKGDLCSLIDGNSICESSHRKNVAVYWQVSRFFEPLY